MPRSKPANNARAPAAGFVAVEITATIERDLKQLDAFPELRLQHAVRVVNGSTGVHHLTLVRVKELLEHVEERRCQRLRDEAPRGTATAYTALAHRLHSAIHDEYRRGAWQDPGSAEVQRRMAAESAMFAVGDQCLYFYDEHQEYGTPARIVAGFALHYARGDGGRYISNDGQRGNYMPGYLVELEGKSGVSYVVRAGKLTRDDCKPTHVRLVK